MEKKPPSSHSNPQVEFAAGLVAGMFGRALTNNVTLGTFLWSSNPTLSLGSAFKQSMTGLGLRSCMLGAAVQHGVLYCTREYLAERKVPTFYAALAAGAAGGTAIHPFVVRFLVQTPKDPVRWPAFPAASGMMHYLQHQPQIFSRGLIMRWLMSSTEWASFFASREVLQQHAPNVPKGIVDFSAASISVAVSTPTFMVYGRQIQTGESIPTAVRQIFFSGSATATRNAAPRALPAAILFFTWGIVEKLAIDRSEAAIAKATAHS